MNDIDKWCAEQCGEKPNRLLWTIKDPRCREIVRERFGIKTRLHVANMWICVVRYKPEMKGKGKTIAEAEIACITAIWEAR